jgi:Domain of Unknown Function (DUF1080)
MGRPALDKLLLLGNSSRVWALVAGLLASSQLAQADPIALFDGRSLDGWRIEGAGVWSVVDRVIVASGSDDGFLVSDREFDDFHLLAEFWVDATTNSGIFIRCKDRTRIHPETCYELNIYDEHPQQEARTGSVVKHVMPPMAQVDTVGQWNTLEAMAKGAVIEVKINGVTTAVLESSDPAAGFIALQHWADGTVKFRKLELNTF